MTAPLSLIVIFEALGRDLLLVPLADGLLVAAFGGEDVRKSSRGIARGGGSL